MEKRKKKRNSLITGPREILAQRAQVHARGQAAQPAHGGAERRGGHHGRGPTRQREGGNGVRGRSAAVRTGRR
jgi:hypothetical protein